MSIRRVLVAFLAIAGPCGGAPSLLAETGGSISGRAVDAVGRPLPNLRVELLPEFQGRPTGVPVSADLTDGRGAWSFSGVSAGQYVVRMVQGRQATGVAVSVADASGVADVMIVAPSLPSLESLRQVRPGAGEEPSDVAAWMLGLSGATVAALSAINLLGFLRDAS